MIKVTPLLEIDEHEIDYDFTHASGPGGQNVNKVSSAVQLRFNVRETLSIPADAKERLIKLAGKHMTTDGTLIIEAKRYRSQERNRQAALERLIRLIQQAIEPPKPRHKTKPTRASVERRLEDKRKRGEVKRMRRDIENVG
jgi:ribosome-associated protein